MKAGVLPTSTYTNWRESLVIDYSKYGAKDRAKRGRPRNSDYTLEIEVLKKKRKAKKVVEEQKVASRSSIAKPLIAYFIFVAILAVIKNITA